LIFFPFTHFNCKTTAFDVIIIGAGASGLIAAIYAARRGRKTAIVDHADQAGRKIRVSGGGHCNITNRRITVDDYFGKDHGFCTYALKQFPPRLVFSMLRNAGIETEEREHGRIFCKNGAGEIVSYLVRAAIDAGVHFFLNTKVSGISYSTSFCVDGHGLLLESSHLLVATGGLARPQIGATAFGYTLAKQFGHTVIPLKPALTGLILSPDDPLLNLQGISLLARLQIKGKYKPVEEPLLFTHQGISGPSVLQISCFWEKEDVIAINFLPSEDLIEQMHKPDNGKLPVKNLVTKFLPERLVKALIPEHLSCRKVAELSRKDRIIIARQVHDYPVAPEDVEGFHRAEVTLGGVSTLEIIPESMESRLKKGLFFCGEVLDITGKLGGYNIHWAFASGYLAGQQL